MDEIMIGIDRASQVAALAEVIVKEIVALPHAVSHPVRLEMAGDLYDRGVRIPSTLGPMEPVQSPKVTVDEENRVELNDPELHALTGITAILTKLTPPARSRIATYLGNRFDYGEDVDA